MISIIRKGRIVFIKKKQGGRGECFEEGIFSLYFYLAEQEWCELVRRCSFFKQFKGLEEGGGTYLRKMRTVWALIPKKR
jgi:hypothetical protein